MFPENDMGVPEDGVRAPLTMEDVFGPESEQEQGGHKGRGEEDGGLGHEEAIAKEERIPKESINTMKCDEAGE